MRQLDGRTSGIE